MLDEALDKLNDDFEDARSPEGIETLVSKTGINKKYNIQVVFKQKVLFVKQKISIGQ